MEDYLPYGRQNISDEDVRAVVDCLRRDFLTCGPEVDRFEKELADFCGAKYAVVCSSGTAALHLAAKAIGTQPGWISLTSVNTFLATANATLYEGGQVEFLDIDLQTGNLSPELLEKRILRGGVNAVYPVHFAGLCCDMEAIGKIAKRQGVWVVEDACHAIGGFYLDTQGNRHRVGSCDHSDMTAFSFHPVKTITTGEGGALTTNNEKLYERLKALRHHGMVRSGWSEPWYYEMADLGYNYRLTDFQCALGRSQLRRLPQFIQGRQDVARWYLKHWPRTELASPLSLEFFEGHAYHLFVAVIDFTKLAKSRTEVMMMLKTRGIGSQVHYIPLNRQPFYRSSKDVFLGRTPNMDQYYQMALSLPMFPSMTEGDVLRVLRALSECIGIE